MTNFINVCTNTQHHYRTTANTVFDADYTLLRPASASSNIELLVRPITEYSEKQAYVAIVDYYDVNGDLPTHPHFAAVFEIRGLDELTILRNLTIVCDLVCLHYRYTEERQECGVYYTTVAMVNGELAPVTTYYHNSTGMLVNNDNDLFTMPVIPDAN